MASRWAFRFLLWYICILCVQPQNRFLFLYPLHIADLCVMGAVGLHFLSASQEGRSFLRFGPATITAMLLMFFSLVSLYTGSLQTNSSWNSDIDIIWKNGMVLILVEAMAFNVKRVWAVQATLLLATLWWIKGGLRLSAAGAMYTGDRIMGPAVSMIENPNGFAYMMAVMVPLYLYFYQKSTTWYMRWGCLALALAAVYIILQTGSRTGLMALCATGVFLLPKYGAKHKVALAIGAVAVVMFTSATGALNIERFKTIPASIKEFLSGTAGVEDYQTMNQDQQSAWERRMKNRDTWRLIKDNFLFGVGVQANDDLVWERYGFAGGQVHNELLYAGKQMGMVGMALYLSLMLTMFTRSIKVKRFSAAHWPALSDLGWTLNMQAIVFIVGGMFSPLPWNPIMMVLVGSASALWSNAQEEVPALFPPPVDDSMAGPGLAVSRT